MLPGLGLLVMMVFAVFVLDTPASYMIVCVLQICGGKAVLSKEGAPKIKALL